MNLRIFQKGFNYSQDGPGNRLVIHLQGCNLHCPWCSNPEGMSIQGGHEESTKQLIEEIKSCKRLFFDGGGVTFTGGECTLQARELLEVLKACKHEDIHTAIETNGTFSHIETLMPFLDLIICDFKHYDFQKLAAATGCTVNCKRILEQYLRSDITLLIRTVLINHFNAQRDDAEKFASFFDGKPCEHVKFEFLAYHEYGKSKWAALGKEYTVKDGFVSPETISLFENIYSQHHLKTIRS